MERPTIQECLEAGAVDVGYGVLVLPGGAMIGPGVSTSAEEQRALIEAHRKALEEIRPAPHSLDVYVAQVPRERAGEEA